MKIIIFLLLFVIGCTFISSNLDGPYKVVHVMDGDTIKLENGMKIRFSGINAAELSDNKCYSNEAKKFVESLLLNQNVYLEEDIVQEDKYDRELRYIHYNNTNFNFILVKEGYAKVYDKFKDTTKYYKEMKELEEEAKLKKKGIWGCGKVMSGETEIINKELFKIDKIIILIGLLILFLIIAKRISAR